MNYWNFLKQALMTGITGIVSLYLAQRFRLPQGYWAVISSIIVIQSDIDATIKMSWNRVAGTAVGAVIGGVFLIFCGEHIWSFGIGLGAVVFLSMSFKLMESYRIAAVTLAIVMLTSQSGEPWLVAWHRFLEVSLGILVALGVTTLIYPLRVYHILSSKVKNKKYTGQRPSQDAY